ncbi:30S ribosomal protein S4 [Candidatus Peregrinibacteria bacterium]|nr:30S ribosomal protein S4 [Candidatus Peregrinibacteria bacterium]
MARYRGPKTKIARREGISLAAFGNYEGAALKAAQKKNYPPGHNGKRGSFSKPSEYAKQLREKQKAKRIYGVLEKQFRRYYKKADTMEMATNVSLLTLLEKRIDNVVYRSGLAETRRQARQMVSHGLLNLNGKRVDIPSIEVSIGDKIEVRDNKKKSPLFDDIKKKKAKAPKWLKVDLKGLNCEVIREPAKDDLEQIIEAQLIVEYYSK